MKAARPLAPEVSGKSPASATLATSLPVVAAYNEQTPPTTQTFVVNFPAAGSYPFELDYTTSGGVDLTLVLSGDSGPVPPSTALLLAPYAVSTLAGGQLQTFTVTAVNSDGSAAQGLPVILTIAGYNAQTRTATTGATGAASITYQGLPGVGMDSVQATAVLNNQTLISNLVVVPWNDTGVNQAPTVQVESPVTVVLPQRAVLNANVQDDGLPNNTLTDAWTQLSGPGTATSTIRRKPTPGYR